MSIIHLVSPDGGKYDVLKEELKCSRLLSRIIDDIVLIHEIPITNISSSIFKIVYDFMKLSIRPTTEFWIREFILENSAIISELLSASNFLEIDMLSSEIIDILAKKVQSCCSIEEMREKLGINNDFTHEEEEAEKNKVAWAFI